MHDWLSRLNPSQRQAVTHPGGPLLILAGAGSGKTRVLTCRIAHLIAAGVDPARICAVTFTNKAAREMQERLRQLAGPPAGAVWVGTFHAICARILRRAAPEADYPASFTIYDSADQQTIIRRLCRDLNLSDRIYHPGAVVAAISRAKDELVDPAGYAQRRARGPWEKQVAEIYRRYQEELRRAGAMDFGDLIMWCVHLIRDGAAAGWPERFQHLLVDEYQDTNRAQYTWVRLMSRVHRNIVAVGDDDQSIYGWRGADIRNILDFERDFPDAAVLRLEQNYRSTQHILDAANRVVDHNVRRKGKRLWTDRGRGEPVFICECSDEHHEASFVASACERLGREGREGPGDIAVLYRIHAQSRVLEEALMQRGLPYRVVGGIRFYERKEIKDICAYLRVVFNPADDLALARCINEPRRGVGPKTWEQLRDWGRRSGAGVAVALDDLDSVPGPGPAVKGRLRDFWSMCRGLERRAREGDITLGDLVEELLSRSGYLAALEDGDDVESQTRRENLREFVGLCRDLEDDRGTVAAVEELLAQAALMTDQDEYEETDTVTLMTLHAAKGLEFPAVFIVGMEEGIFPHERALTDPAELEEERRLCYVGMTRAQRLLFLCRAGSRTLFGVAGHRSPSRFLDELPPDCCARIGTVDPAAPGRAPRSPARSPLRRRSDAAEHKTRQASTGAEGATRQAPAHAERRTRQAPAGVDFTEGDRVLHPRFGRGTVVGMRRTGEDVEVAVAFAAGGVKRFIQSIAGLRRAD